jgi:hypothetical protein
VSSRARISKKNITIVAVRSAHEIGSAHVSRLRLRSSPSSMCRALCQTITIRSAPRTMDNFCAVGYVSDPINACKLYFIEFFNHMQIWRRRWRRNGRESPAAGSALATFLLSAGRLVVELRRALPETRLLPVDHVRRALHVKLPTSASGAQFSSRENRETQQQSHFSGIEKFLN